jgi:hypothetical protein
MLQYKVTIVSNKTCIEDWNPCVLACAVLEIILILSRGGNRANGPEPLLYAYIS